MSSISRGQWLLSALRLFSVLALLLMPIPWLADAYAYAYGAAGNRVLCPAMNRASDVSMQFDLPERIAVHGSWKGKLRIQSNASGRSVNTTIDIRSFSYRPLATFVALGLVTPLPARAKRLTRLSIVAVGTLIMFAVGLWLSSLPILARLGSTGALGVLPGLAVRTLYEAVATPVMMYAIPLIVFGLLALVRCGSLVLFPNNVVALSGLETGAGES